MIQNHNNYVCNVVELHDDEVIIILGRDTYEKITSIWKYTHRNLLVYTAKQLNYDDYRIKIMCFICRRIIMGSSCVLW